ncbi:hypothetical protein BKA66DRAFT_280599 [Pyrenochaeta sp. MPI-SDFR-AT-0127]|nr:hypothetical protein BKA66DRAFT_280599 [Pyrenochaeta sp. MPI-SDFR-AT-0127]
MSSALPTIPRYLFGVAEPAVLVLAFVVTSLLPEYYVSSLSKLASSRSLLPTEQIGIYQISNLFLLVAVLSLYVLNSIDDVKVARAFLTALWWGDLGHLGVTTWCLGWETLRNMGSWSLVVWGNIGIPTFLFTMRTLYFLGVFGSDVNAKY